MAGQNTITVPLNAIGTGSSSGEQIYGGLYKYVVDAVFGSSSAVSVEIGVGSSWVGIEDILGNTVTNTDTGAVEESWDIYLPAGLVRITVGTATVTSGNAYIAPIDVTIQ